MKLPAEFCNPVTRKIASLVDICNNDESINKDARLLDAIQKAFDENESSVLFKPHVKRMKTAFIEARRSVKKRISQAKSDATMEGSDDERNAFDLFLD